MNRQRLEHLTVGLIGLFMLPVGLQAAFTPRSFFDDFPLGRGWIFKDSPTYNEHLIRDVGVLFLSLIIVTGWTILRRGSTRPLAVAWLFQGVMHVVYHGGHLHGFGAVDKVALIGSLATIPVLAAISLWAGWRPVDGQ